MRNGMIVSLLLVLATSVYAAPEKEMTADKVKDEFKYADKLRALGMDEFADTVISKIPADKIPAELKHTMTLAKFQTYLRKNYKDEPKIKAYITALAGDNMELLWMLKLRWADEMWTRGEIDKCLEVYQSFMEFYDKLLQKSKDDKSTKPKADQEVG